LFAREEIMREETDGKILISKHGYEEMIKKLEYLKNIKRQEISEKIKQAIAFGDLAENAEYDAAKQEQAYVESEIADLEAQLARAEIIEEDSIETDKVNIGCKIKVRDMDTKEEMMFYIKSPLEADPINYKISWSSPVGQGLMGHRKNDVVEIRIPKGVVRYKILKIERGN